DRPLGPATQILIDLIRTFDTAPLNVALPAAQHA
ncbi:LysR family transcriptional regulator, partial [Pseudomonas syringae pv. maculicola]